MVSVDAAGDFQDDYRGTASSQWTGVAFGGWAWSTRFIVGYTGRGVEPLGGRALADVRSYSADDHAVLLQPIPPSTQLRKKEYRCPASFVPGPGGRSVGLGQGSLEPIGTGSLIAAARNVGGYDRALVVSTPAHIGFECHPLAGEGPGEKAGATDLVGPDTYTVRAPSVDSFLGGKGFGRSCWQTVVTDLPNPFPHHYIYEAYLGVQFTYFPKEQAGGQGTRARRPRGLRPEALRGSAPGTGRGGAATGHGPGVPLRASTRPVGAALAAVGLAVTIATGALGADPSRLTLRLGDLPAGFALQSANVVSLAAAAKEGPQTVADYRRWGYVTGYEADFLPDQTGASVRGAVLIVSSVSVYKTRRGAAASWTSSVQACLRKRPTCIRLSLSPKIGDGAVLLKARTRSRGVTLSTLAVVWHRGSMKAGVLAAGVGDGPSAATVVALAAKQDGHMASVR